MALKAKPVESAAQVAARIKSRSKGTGNSAEAPAVSPVAEKEVTALEAPEVAGAVVAPVNESVEPAAVEAPEGQDAPEGQEAPEAPEAQAEPQPAAPAPVTVETPAPVAAPVVAAPAPAPVAAERGRRGRGAAKEAQPVGPVNWVKHTLLLTPEESQALNQFTLALSQLQGRMNNVTEITRRVLDLGIEVVNKKGIEVLLKKGNN